MTDPSSVAGMGEAVSVIANQARSCRYLLRTTAHPAVRLCGRASRPARSTTTCTAAARSAWTPVRRCR